MIATAAYVASIVLVNWLFTVLPLVDLGPLGMWPPASIVVGLIFVLRDVAQRRVGHWVIPAMLLGGAISYFMADPFVAVASVTAFIVSETIDWAVYTWTRRPFRERVLYSSAVGTPIDSGVFLMMIGHFSFTAVVVMTVSKMLAAVAVWKGASRVNLVAA